ncbi:MAG: DNA-binding protein [Limnohabitans sp.]
MNKTVTPLENETRSALPTWEAAIHLGRKEQTLRIWAMESHTVAPIKPIRICGRLAWRTNDLRKLLGIEV